MRLAGYKQAWWWGIAGLALALALWGLGAAIMPFILGMAIAYMLDPVADRLERMGLSRTLAVVTITLFTVLALIAALGWLVPLLVGQAAQLIETAPAMLDQLQSVVQRNFPDLMPNDGLLETGLAQARETIGNSLGGIMGTVMGSIRGVISVAMVLVIAPVVAFYMLLDWDRMVARVDALLPREHAPVLRRIFADIDDSVSGFLRGEALVILILGVFYSVGLALIGLPFGIVIGVSAAALSFIPYVGTLVGGVLSIGVAMFTFWDEPTRIGAVVAIFVAGQMAESNYLQPKIVGGHVGLHPVWLMLALSVFGTLFGFVGLLVAVPVGAALGVVVRFAVERYKTSALFTGREAPAPMPDPMLIELVPRGTFAHRAAVAQDRHEAAVEAALVDDTRRQAREAAAEAAQADGARLAVATLRVPRPTALDAAAAAQTEPELRTWGGKTPDGTDPDDPHPDDPEGTASRPGADTPRG